MSLHGCMSGSYYSGPATVPLGQDSDMDPDQRLTLEGGKRRKINDWTWIASWLPKGETWYDPPPFDLLH